MSYAKIDRARELLKAPLPKRGSAALALLVATLAAVSAFTLAATIILGPGANTPPMASRAHGVNR